MNTPTSDCVQGYYGVFLHCTFTGKELDEETGYGYFGARYMDHELTAMWLSVDPLADKYPSISPYAYCAWNPVKLVDPDGNEINPVYGLDGSYRGCTKEGYTGEIIIYDGNETFSSLSKEELYRKDNDATQMSGHHADNSGDADHFGDFVQNVIVGPLGVGGPSGLCFYGNISEEKPPSHTMTKSTAETIIGQQSIRTQREIKKTIQSL